jgi:hypothetical protein
VSSTTVDTAIPVVEELVLVTPPDGRLDVRESPGEVVVEARITDDLSGVSEVRLCPWRPDPRDGYTPTGLCTSMAPVLLEGREDWYRGRFTVPQASLSGDWNLEISAVDRVNWADHTVWFGPDLYRSTVERAEEPTPLIRQLPGGQGRLTVLGTTGDDVAPTVVATSMTPTEVDTLYRDQTITVKVHAVDAGADGVNRVGVWLHSSSDGSGTSSGSPETRRLTSGTPQDGWWTVDVVLPQGTPPGTYYLMVVASDSQHTVSFTSPGSPYEGGYRQETLPERAVVTVVPHEQ